MQNHSHSEIKHLLLDMISTTRVVSAERTAAFSGDDWAILCDMAGQHRLGPLLHHHSQSTGKHWHLPIEVRERWSNAFRNSAVRSLEMKRGLLALAKLLDHAAVPYAALKGSWLSLHAYAHPALRPMRDIDVLVPTQDAMTVFELLINSGYQRLPGDVAPPEFIFARHKHLPALVCPNSGRTIEIHTRLMEHIPETKTHGTIADTAAVLERRRAIQLGADALSCLAPTDTLLHLIVHSAYDHQFNNGPLVMNDLAAMLDGIVEIEWDRFWSMAEAGDWSKGSLLLLEMTKCYHRNTVFQVPQSLSDRANMDVVEIAALLTLLDFDQTSSIRFRKETSGRIWSRATFKYLWDRAFPRRHQIATFAGLPLASKRVWLHLPAWAISRTRDVVLKEPTADAGDDAIRAARVEDWLSEKTLR